MRRLLLLLLPAAALLAGCTTAAPAPVSTPSAPAATPSISPLAEPTPLPSEIARGAVTGTTVSSTSGRLPGGTPSLYVHAACSGPAGSTMHYELRGRDGTLFGPSADLECTGEESTAGSRGAGRLPATAQVVVEGSRGVTGWAVLSTSAAR